MRKAPGQIALVSAVDLMLGYKNGKEKLILFEDINLALYPGQLVCLMGPNGVGKSSLLRTIAGLQPSLAGKIIFAGHADERFKNVAVVLSDKIAVANMTAFELITYGRYPYTNWNMTLRAEDRAAVDHAIAMLNISHVLDKKIDELSDGQMQLVQIARALAQETPVLLLDEPTAHLDLDNRIEIMNLLRALAAKTNKAILIATHELDLAIQTADIVWLATRHKKILTGIPEDLVLARAFDEVFKFKGYDLLTGKIDQQAHRGVTLRLSSPPGNDALVLWTKNALERNGYEVNDHGATEIIISVAGDQITWTTRGRHFLSLEDLCLELAHIGELQDS